MLTNPSLLNVYFLQFSCDSLDVETIFSSDSDDNNPKDYIQFIYPELFELSYDAVCCIPKLVFSFVRTTMEHDFEYCYCYRYTSETPKIIIIVASEYNPFYINVLNVLDDNIDYVNIPSLLTELIEGNYSLKQSTVYISSLSIPYSKQNIIIPTLTNFGVGPFVDIVYKMLLEERFIFLSSDVKKLLPTIQSFLMVLNPFVWQHIFIPVLPLHLYAYLTSILPCLIGCTRGTYGHVVIEFGQQEDVHTIDIDKYVEETKCLRTNPLVCEEIGIMMGRLDTIVQSPDKYNDEDVMNVFKSFYEIVFHNILKCFKRTNGEVTFNEGLFIEQTKPSLKDFVRQFTQSQLCFQHLESNRIQLLNKNKPNDILQNQITIPYTQLESISSIGRRCGGCFSPIEPKQVVYQFSDKTVFHRQCARCCVCGKFSIEKTCNLCDKKDKPPSKEEIEKANKYINERLQLLQRELKQNQMEYSSSHSEQVNFKSSTSLTSATNPSARLAKLQPPARHLPPQPTKPTITDDSQLLQSYSSRPPPIPPKPNGSPIISRNTVQQQQKDTPPPVPPRKPKIQNYTLQRSYTVGSSNSNEIRQTRAISQINSNNNCNTNTSAHPKHNRPLPHPENRYSLSDDFTKTTKRPLPAVPQRRGPN
ncbi:UDENN domain-containing protein [Entamoeba marina]